MEQTTDALKTVERELVCNQIQIQNLDYIQSLGVLVVVDKNFNILQVSENVKKWFGIDANELLNQKIDKVPINHFLRDVLAFVSLKGKAGENSWVDINEEANYEVTIHEEELFFILEYIFIPKDENKTNLIKLVGETFALSEKAPSLKSFPQLCQTYVERIKEALGFDKVLIYQFLEDQHGEVIAEAKDADMEAYLEFHFPKSDIPPQVRELYLKNPLRYIYDSQQEPVPIIPQINPITNMPINLSSCILKGVIPVHREYINNMHIRTSISYAVRVQGKLWGLISCHHKQPKFFSHRDCLALAHFAYLFSNECLLNSFKEINLIKDQFNAISEVVDKLTYKDKSIHEAFLEKKTSIMRLVNATGAALNFDGQLTLVGKTPSVNQTEFLIQWLDKNNNETIFHTDSLSKIIPEAGSYKEIASGLIAASLGSRISNYIFWFRSEQLTSVNWGGNPQEIGGDPSNLKAVKPRNSFRLWREEISGYSKKWLLNELGIVAELVKGITQSFLSIYFLKKMIAEADLLKIQIAADKASEGILILDQNGKVEWMNSRLIHLFGKKSLNEVLFPLISLLENHSQSNVETIRKAISLKEKISLEIFIGGRCVLFALSPFKNFDNEEVKLIGIATDITEINRITKEIETKAEALDLANQHLNKLMKEKDQFIRMAAHDLRNPISTILMAASYIENIQKKEENTNLQKMSTIIINQSKSMLDLLNDILNVNILQSGQFIINKQKVDVKIFIEEICEMHKLIASKNQIEIQIEERLAQPCCDIDKIKIKQVIDNFLSNAIKFSPPNSVIKVVCQTLPTSFKVEVQDQGPGISEKSREKIFEQIPKIVSKTTGEEAHGLGLSICKQIIRAHNGEIGVYSIADRGAVFYFEVKI